MRALRFTFLAVFIAVVFLAMAPAGFAQCAMCKASLTGSNNATFIRNLNIGVLVLLLPPVAMFCSFLVVLKRRHKGEGAGDDA